MTKAWHHSSQNISVLFSQARRESDTFPARGRQEFLPSLDGTLLREVGRPGDFNFMSWIGLNHERAIRFSEYNPEACRIRSDGNSTEYFFKKTHFTLIYNEFHHASLPSARIPTKDHHEMTTHAAWMNPRVFKPFSRSPVHVYVGKLFPRKNNVFLSKYPATFPPRNPCYWSNRQFEETRQTSTTAAILAVGFGTWGEHIRFQALSFFQ